MYRCRPAGLCLFWIIALLLGVPVRDSFAETVRFSDEEMCALATWVVIGKITAVQFGIHQGTGFAMTTATVSVERIAHGQPPSSFSITVLGGVINGKRRVVGGEPILDVGSRHLLLLAKAPDHPPMLIAGMNGAIRLDPDVALPSNGDLQVYWEANCE